MREVNPLCELPALVREVSATLPAEAARRPGPGGSFSLVEHAWHLADLEAEAFGARIERLLGEDEPFLEDFDGERAARERRYRERSAAEGVARYGAARAANLERLGRASVADGMRGGTLEGVGRILLRDLPVRMLSHDRSHAAELASLLRLAAPGHASLAALEGWAARVAPGVASPCARRAAAGRALAAPALATEGRPRPIGARARRALGAMLGAGAPSVGRVAAALRMSPRTLQRRLSAQGMTLQCLVEEERMAAALALVREGARPLGEVAALVGYSELRAFLRAFKRWTGGTPAAFRRAPALIGSGGC